MRISDWSSDVCSSDLYVLPGQARASIIPPVDRRRVHQERGHPFDHRTSFPSNQDISRIKQMAGQSRAGAAWHEREGKGGTLGAFIEIGPAEIDQAVRKYGETGRAQCRAGVCRVVGERDGGRVM